MPFKSWAEIKAELKVNLKHVTWREGLDLIGRIGFLVFLLLLAAIELPPVLTRTNPLSGFILIIAVILGIMWVCQAGPYER
jgi:hypothetical protein